MRALNYVILHHEDVAEPHFDLLFETLPGSQLSTWRSPVWPIEERVGITRLRDHRRLYLDFTGEIPGHRGRVYQIAKGDCEIDIGENAIWTIRFLSGTFPQTLVLSQLEREEWEAAPAKL